MTELIITFFIGLIGSWIAVRLKVPAGQMIGAMFAVAAFNILTDAAYFPKGTKIMTQMISGLFIGTGITRSELKSLKYAIKPAILNIILILLFSLMMAVSIYFVSNYSFATAALGSAPGGVMDMALIGMDMGADTSAISILQTVRLMAILGLFPSMFKFLIEKTEAKQLEEAKPLETENIEAETTEKNLANETWKNALKTLVVAGIGAFLGYITGIPAGVLIFSVIGVGIQNIIRGTAYMPKELKKFAQVCAGALIGEGITLSTVLGLKYAIIPAIMMVVGFTIMVLIQARILQKTTKIDIATALFACAPGGASNMALISGDLGANPAKVSVIQTLRLIGVIALYPWAIQLISHLLS